MGFCLSIRLRRGCSSHGIGRTGVVQYRRSTKACRLRFRGLHPIQRAHAGTVRSRFESPSTSLGGASPRVRGAADPFNQDRICSRGVRPTPFLNVKHIQRRQARAHQHPGALIPRPVMSVGHSAACRASWLTAASASLVKTWSVLFSSSKVASRRLTASLRPSCAAHAFSVPYREIS
jgi:hypothetical protein